jgi:hypothetical protein
MLSTELIQEVRNKIDEDDSTDISDAVILASLNRAMTSFARRQASRHPELRRQSTTVSLNSDGETVTLPESAFGFRVSHIALARSDGSFRTLETLSARDKESYEYPSGYTTTEPTHCFFYQDRVQILPRPASGLTFRVFFDPRPEPLVLPLGRITSRTTSQFTVHELTTTNDNDETVLEVSLTNLKCYINAVDDVTGKIKGTYQVSALSTSANTIDIKTSSLDNATVFGRTVSTSIDTAEVSVHDQICWAKGSCIPYLMADYSDLFIMAAYVELTRDHLKEDVTLSMQELRAMEREANNDFAGRLGVKRIVRRARQWKNSAY